MIQKFDPLSSKDFSKGLVTNGDFLNNDPDTSPNTMDVKWRWDGAIQKRYGSSSTNTISIGAVPSNSWTIFSSSSLTTELLSYWKMDESSDTRFDQRDVADLTDFGGTQSIVGIRNQAANFAVTGSQSLYYNASNAFAVSDGSFAFSLWVYFNTFGGVDQNIFCKRESSSSAFEWDCIYSYVSNALMFRNSTSGTIYDQSIVATSMGALNTATWYNIVCWQSANSHIGISVNLSANTKGITQNLVVGTAGIIFSGVLNISPDPPVIAAQGVQGRVDEAGFWTRVLTTTERINLYGGGSGNTYDAGGLNGFTWGMFDFGASNIRWLTVAAGTGIYASSNRGTTFVSVATSRTQNYQYFERSKNVLIATSDSYDVPLYWAGSTGTFMNTLAPNSAPLAKYSVNYNGFLILLNFTDSNGNVRNRGFSYADENLQLTDPWNFSFDIPSSADDEITAPFILNRFLYISTKYRIYRVAFVGGNPDWKYLKITDWGFVPRTVKLMTLKGGQVAVGMDWNRRIRAFDGSADTFVSDNVENDNNLCDFALKKISYFGSGLIVSNAEVDINEQEYRLNVAIGPMSSQTTHAILLNGRTLSLFPYQNQQYQCMCMAQSNNQSYLMAADRSGFIYLLNSGNTDSGIPINDVYDSPVLYVKNPAVVSKSQELDIYFSNTSAGKVYHQDRTDFNSVYTPMKPFKDLVMAESNILSRRTLDIPSVDNTYQFRLSSSAGTADIWEVIRFDLFKSGLGYGQGGK